MRWEPIETAPRDATVILLWADAYHYPVVGWYSQAFPTGWCDVWEHEWNRPKQPTHWMRVPEPPK